MYHIRPGTYVGAEKPKICKITVRRRYYNISILYLYKIRWFIEHASILFLLRQCSYLKSFSNSWYFFYHLWSVLWRLKLLIFKWKHSFSTVNYSVHNFSGKFALSQLKYVRVVFELFSFVSVKDERSMIIYKWVYKIWGILSSILIYLHE